MTVAGDSPSAELVLPQAALQLLPLTPQPLVAWDTRGDLQQFLVALHTPGGYTEYGRHLYREGYKSAGELAARFQNAAAAAQPSAAACVDAIVPPEFRHSAEFGGTAKSLIAYRAIVDALLSESAFFSIAHLLESETDLDCSTLLAEHLYYKQALQTLRNLLEASVFPIHLCGHPDDFQRWRTGGYRIPRMRGPGGMLDRAVQEGVLPPEVSVLVGDLYDQLNGAVHASATRLIHRGVMDGAYYGHVFKPDEFAFWSNATTRVVHAVALVLYAHLAQWDRTRIPGVLQCDICHGTSLEAQEQHGLAAEVFITWRCPTCGHETTRRRDA